MPQFLYFTALGKTLQGCSAYVPRIRCPGRQYHTKPSKLGNLQSTICQNRDSHSFRACLDPSRRHYNHSRRFGRLVGNEFAASNASGSVQCAGTARESKSDLPLERPKNGPAPLVLLDKTGSRRAGSKTCFPAEPHKPRAPNKLDRRWTTPSNSLIDALQYLGHYHAVPRLHPSKVDLSYTHPRLLGVDRTQKPLGADGRAVPGRSAASDLSLPTILASYLRNVFSVSELQLSGQVQDTRVDEAVVETFNEDSLAYLNKRGFHVGDVVNWAWIVTGHNAETASLRLWLAQYRGRPEDEHPTQVPIFVFLFLLRRPKVNATALRILLVYAWSQLKGHWPPLNTLSSKCHMEEAATIGSWSPRPWQVPKGCSINGPGMNGSTLIIVFVRLLRHARRVWPEAIVSITEMISYLAGDPIESTTQESHSSKRTSNRLTFVFNRALSLLSIPSSLSPFQSIPIHQRAQFNLIKRMSSFNPAIAITQEGYRAIVKVQVAHKKTLREHQWAASKARSWPPWKEMRMGIDMKIRTEDGWTRATEAMLRMKEAGYAPSRWDKVADIFAGWDTDGSPTIQTRSILRRVTGSGKGHFDQKDPVTRKTGNADNGIEDHNDIWAARIDATRTVQEAWACFLAHEDRQIQRSPSIYFAMFQKLVFEEKRLHETPASEAQPEGYKNKVQPGDGKEVFPSPISPQEAVYVRSQPPKVVDLFDKMVREGVQPSQRCLAFLISHADSIGIGLKYVRDSGVIDSTQVKALTASNRSFPDLNLATSQAIHSIPVRLFVAFIRLLCRLSSLKKGATQDLKQLDRDFDQMLSLKPRVGIIQPSRPLLHALRLMSLRRPRYRPPWTDLLSAIAQPNTFSTESKTTILEVHTWKLMQDVVSQMKLLDLELDLQSFQILCVGLEKALIASRKVDEGRTVNRTDLENANHPPKFDSGQASDELAGEAEKLLKHGPNYIKHAFEKLIGTDTSHLAGEVNSCSPSLFLPREIIRTNPSTLFPSLLATPGPSQLHAYIRVLGLFGDFQGLISLVRWMVIFKLELDVTIYEASNGRRLMRRSLTALRVFLERSWEDSAVEEDDQPRQARATARNDMRANEEVVEHVRSLVESQESWGGWPQDEEVKMYCQRGRFA
ncbi:MAG: hypothetical protein M1837_002870 [Sclerophora amabilis]|nr:MAG: hypothetical protein M1837_002870 [Sclerophora amabilis]